jgi:quinol monooxygenase YgiN
MIILSGTIRFPADKLEAARPAMKAVVEASRQEDGCILYGFGQDVLDPALIRVSEVWRDQAALDAHWSAPHFLAWREVASGLGMHDRQITIYEAAPKP